MPINLQNRFHWNLGEIIIDHKNKKIDINYFDEYGNNLLVNFGPNTFNYYNFDGVFNNWNKKAKEFLINGYKLLINIFMTIYF